MSCATTKGRWHRALHGMALAMSLSLLAACGTPAAKISSASTPPGLSEEPPDCCKVPLLESLERERGKTPPTDPAPVEEAWGVRFESVRRSGANTLIDVRIRVLDAQRAAPLFSRGSKARLIHEASGLAADVPVPGKIGPLRQTLTGDVPKADRVYFLLFGNPGRLIAPGDEVRLEIDNFLSSPLIVQ